MARRLNISINEQLYAQIKRFKGHMNVSRICQEALTEHIDNFIDNYERLSEYLNHAGLNY